MPEAAQFLNKRVAILIGGSWYKDAYITETCPRINLFRIRIDDHPDYKNGNLVYVPVTYIRIINKEGNLSIKDNNNLFNYIIFSKYHEDYDSYINNNVILTELNIFHGKIYFDLPLRKDGEILIHNYILSELCCYHIHADIKYLTGMNCNNLSGNVVINIYSRKYIIIKLTDNIILDEIKGGKYKKYVDQFAIKYKEIFAESDPLAYLKRFMSYLISKCISKKNELINIIPMVLLCMNELHPHMDHDDEIINLIGIIINMISETQLINNMRIMMYSILKHSVLYFKTTSYKLFLKNYRHKSKLLFNNTIESKILNYDKNYDKNYYLCDSLPIPGILFHIYKDEYLIAKLAIISRKHYIQSRNLFKNLIETSISRLARVQAFNITRIAKENNYDRSRLLKSFHIRDKDQLKNKLSCPLQDVIEFYIDKFISGRTARAYRTGGKYISQFRRIRIIKNKIKKILKGPFIKANTKYIQACCKVNTEQLNINKCKQNLLKATIDKDLYKKNVNDILDLCSDIDVK